MAYPYHASHIEESMSYKMTVFSNKLEQKQLLSIVTYCMPLQTLSDHCALPVLQTMSVQKMPTDYTNFFPVSRKVCLCSFRKYTYKFLFFSTQIIQNFSPIRNTKEDKIWEVLPVYLSSKGKCRTHYG